MAWKVVLLAPLAIVAFAGTLSAPWLLDRLTVVEPAAALVKLTVQVDT